MMNNLVSNIYLFFVNNARILYLAICTILLIKGIVYLSFPEKIKAKFERCPLKVFRFFGISTILISLLFFYLYMQKLRWLFM